MNIFGRASILLPGLDELEKWAVIACDQFTSDPVYWQRVRAYIKGAPSTLHMILPEAELDEANEDTVRAINANMMKALKCGVLREYHNAYIYVERTLQNGAIRPGIVGMVDLEAYDYHPGSVSAVRATEKTVLERIPPRKMVRRDAPLEFPHVLMLCDDEKKNLIEPIQIAKDSLPKLYDFDLMEDGGHISGWLLQGGVADDFDKRFAKYCKDCDSRYADLTGAKVLLAVGDGNHSLATAKSCYEDLKAANPNEDFSDHPARFALVELENIHDDSLCFEPIHRIVTGVDVKQLLHDIRRICAPGGFRVTCVVGTEEIPLELDSGRGQLAVAILQEFLDEWMSCHGGRVDYIHGDEELKALAKTESSVGFLLPAMEKHQLFRGVIAGGVLPRKTFSMGHAREKRYYLEGRKIK